MSGNDQISVRYAALGRHLGRVPLSNLPTPLYATEIQIENARYPLLIKNDGMTGTLYGGNKVRKLEYALWPAIARKKTRVATFGAVGSNHALATALYAKQLGLATTCFLVHQKVSDLTRTTLQRHLANRTRLVRFGGAYSKRIATLRQHLGDRDSWVVPAGGSSWRGTVGFVNAGLELAQQIAEGAMDVPDRIYIATGTMGSAAGLAIGLACAGLRSVVHAIRVSAPHIANEAGMTRLIDKTAMMLHRIDPAFPQVSARDVHLRMRHAFFAGGYAQSDTATDNAIRVAREHLNLTLETTYTGKAMAALLHDLPGLRDQRALFWNTYNASPITEIDESMIDDKKLPEEFRRYLF